MIFMPHKKFFHSLIVIYCLQTERTTLQLNCSNIWEFVFQWQTWFKAFSPSYGTPLFSSSKRVFSPGKGWKFINVKVSKLSTDFVVQNHTFYRLIYVVQGDSFPKYTIEDPKIHKKFKFSNFFLNFTGWRKNTVFNCYCSYFKCKGSNRLHFLTW